MNGLSRELSYRVLEKIVLKGGMYKYEFIKIKYIAIILYYKYILNESIKLVIVKRIKKHK